MRIANQTTENYRSHRLVSGCHCLCEIRVMVLASTRFLETGQLCDKGSMPLFFVIEQTD